MCQLLWIVTLWNSVFRRILKPNVDSTEKNSLIGINICYRERKQKWKKVQLYPFLTNSASFPHCTNACLSQIQRIHGMGEQEETLEIKLISSLCKEDDNAQENKSLSQGKHKDFITETRLELRTSKPMLFWMHCSIHLLLSPQKTLSTRRYVPWLFYPSTFLLPSLSFILFWNRL